MIIIDISVVNLLLSGICDVINNVKVGVSVSIINVGNGEYCLLVILNDIGFDNVMIFLVSGDDVL